jgi:hypothetical protein
MILLHCTDFNLLQEMKKGRKAAFFVLGQNPSTHLFGIHHRHRGCHRHG